MSLVIRLDVDRPYGRVPMARHILSRVSSDYYFPRIGALGFLLELAAVLKILNEAHARSYVFFRRCTLPSACILDLMAAGPHEVGLHLENSRSFSTFLDEKNTLEQHTRRKITAFSKHGSGADKFGRRHYAPYEPDRYVEWATRGDMTLFLGNLQDPNMRPVKANDNLTVFPAAFWLEPHWRDTRRFSANWLVSQARERDIVLLVHPENVLASAALTTEFRRIIRATESRILP